MPSNPPSLNPTFTDENPFPSLPPIRDIDIRTKIFTHRSLYARPNHVFEDHPDDPSPDNEKFEHLGDTVLGLTITRLLHDMYPNLRVGPSTKIRALIVGNATLASISCRYKLPAQLRLHPAQAITLKASTHPTSSKFVSSDQFTWTLTDDMFLLPHAQSYVGGLYLDQGLPAAEEWLKLLFIPYATEAYIHVRKEHGLPPLSSSASPPLSPSSSLSSASSSSPSGSDTTLLTSASEVSKKGMGATSTSAHHNLHRLPPASGTPTTTGHLALFNQQLQKAKREIEWIYDDRVAKGTATTPIWVVRAEVDGEVFGRGKGATKKAARNEAAKEGLVQMGIIV